MASEEPSVRSPSASPAPESLQARIAARLAAIDTESEDDEPKTTSSKSKKSPRPTQDSDSEEEIVRRPRGRLAAQMQAGGDQRSDSEEPESFLDRIQKRLEAAEKADENDAEDTVMGEAEDEDDIPAARRRLQKKPARETTPKPQSPARSPTPGLFVSPEKQSPTKRNNETTANDSDSDASLPALKNSRFQALVERKRQERLAREAEEEKKKAERMERQAAVNVDLFDDEDDANVSDITDDEGGRKLSQAARPARKAGKKAIEEMNRETQRMARNMQLAHEAKTRKKFTKADFLDRFNFRKNEATLDPKTTSSSRPTTPVSAPQTDAEMKDSETPPSSPPIPKASTPSKAQDATTTAAHAPDTLDDNDELPSLDDVFEISKKLDKGKGKAVAVPTPKKSPAKETKPKRQVRIKMPSVSAYHTVVDLDDDLEITDVRKAKLAAIFNSIPQRKARENSSLHALRRLAQAGSPERSRKGRHEKPGMTVGELQLTLQQRARQQAKLEREKRLEYLKSKGVVVQTAEEREREMQDVEDIVARARREAEEIMARERDAAKQEKKEKRKNGELDPFDDSDDEEYEGSDEEVEGDVELELSGSEEEAEDASDNEAEGNALVDDEAGNSGSEHSDVEADDITGKVDLADSEDDMALPTKNVRRSKKTHVISDDEDEDDIVEATPRPRTATQQSPAAPNTKSPAAPTSVLRSAKKTFIPGLPVTGAAGLGLTQIFAGTMDDSQAAPGTIPSQSPMPDFDSLPDSLTIGNNTQQDGMILDSQRFETQQDSADGVHLHFTQSQAHGFDSLMRDDEPATQMSMDATQDEGLKDYTPLRSRFVEAPASTVETMVLDEEAEHDTVLESPLVRRGRLRRKIDVTAALAEEVEEEETQRAPSPEVDEFGFNTTTAFNVMKDAIKKQEKQKKLAEYNRKKSKAKEMVEEQAEESEDEYAGLGGVDGEDSDDDDAASVKEMIDDQSGMNADDERRIAALHAERERAADEKMVDRLFHDVTTGMLRRKRGADYDLSDSDDGGEARRRMKRRQFQKMQQALFADERIKKIAEKPGNQAFLRTIEDRGSDDEMDFLHIAAPESMRPEESQSQDQTVPDSQPTDQRQPLGSNPANRPAAILRRTKDGKKPSNLGEIRESVSSLLEDFSAEVIPATDPASDSEADDEGRPGTSRSNKENDSPGRNPRRTNPSTRPAVVDRITLKRQSSSNMSASSSKLAFAMPGGGVSASSSGSFKVPALLRRATTNSSSFNKSAPGASAGTPFSASGGGSSGFGDDGKIKKNASKRSGVSALARENERRAAIQENEKRREARKWKGAERRISAVGGLFGAGKFE